MRQTTWWWLQRIIGIALLGVGIWLVFQVYRANGLSEQTPLYDYRSVDATPISSMTTKVASLAPQLETSSFQVIARSTDQILASTEVIHHPDQGEVLIAWNSHVTEPVLRSNISAEEDAELITALRKYLPADALILSMPALSRRLSMFVEAEFPLSNITDYQSLIIPQPWLNLKDKIHQIEARWQPEADQTKTNTVADSFFTDFLNALIASEQQGIQQLQTLAGRKNDLYIILHIRDIFDIAVAIPDKISVGFRDFPTAGHVHDITRLVKVWMSENGYQAYTVTSSSSGTVRAYFLSDSENKSSLVTQLLPFNTAKVAATTGSRIVYQHAGYWVYKIIDES